MNPAPHLPRALGFLIAGGVASGPSGQLTIQNVISDVATWVFPQTLPPVQLVAILVGGQPGHIYTPRLRVKGPPNDQVLGEGQAPDTPFTTQIARVNLLVPVQSISAEPIVTTDGTYVFELMIEGQVIAQTPLKIVRVAQPPNIVLPPQGQM